MEPKLDSTLLYVIDQTTKMAKQHSQRQFDSLHIDITVEQWVVLKVIEEKNILSQIELAKATYRDPASITRTLDILQKKGLIIRSPLENNRRQYNIQLTDKGRNFVIQNMPLVQNLRNISTKGLSENEIETLLQLLYKVQRNFKTN